MARKSTGHHNGLTIRQIKYVEARAKGYNKLKSMREAGYAAKSPPCKIEQSPILKPILLRALNRAGVTEDYLANKMHEGLEANDYRYFSKDGVVTDKRVVPDMAVRERYLRTTAEIVGLIRNPSIENLNIGLISATSEKPEESWGRIEVNEVEEQAN